MRDSYCITQDILIEALCALQIKTLIAHEYVDVYACKIRCIFTFILTLSPLHVLCF